MFAVWKRELDGEPVTSIVERILFDTGYKQMLNAEQTIEAETRLENLNEFLTVTKQLDENEENRDLSLFLEQLALMSDVDNYDQDADAVSMMTLHAAKVWNFRWCLWWEWKMGYFQRPFNLGARPDRGRTAVSLCWLN